MISYDEYKNKVYKIFLSRCLIGVSKEEKIKYLDENEDMIIKSYKGDKYEYKNFNEKKVFNDNCIYSDNFF